MANPEDKQMKMQWITVDGRTVPLVLPQIWDPDKEDWVVTSTENPLQVDAQLTGRNVEKIHVYDQKTNTDGSTIRDVFVDLSKYKHISVFVQRTFDVEPELQIRSTATLMHETETDTWSEVSMPIKNRYYTLMVNTKFDFLGTMLAGEEEVEFRVIFPEAPTSGTISLYILGVPA